MSDILSVLPPDKRAQIETMAARIGVGPRVIAAAILMSDAVKGFTEKERNEAVAVMMGLALRGGRG
jgi:hypothetical protein